MKIVITINQQGLTKDFMNASETGYTLTAMYSEMSDILRDHVSYYPEILCDTYFQVYEDIEGNEDYEDDYEIEYKFIEMPYISSAVEDILKNIKKLRDIFDKLNTNLPEEDKLNFDPMILICIEGTIAKEIIKKMNSYFNSKNMELQAIDYLEMCQCNTFEELGNIIKRNFNLSDFYMDDSILSAYSITQSLISSSRIEKGIED